MKNRADNATNLPHRPRRLALVDADVKLHHTVREHFTGQEAGWHVDAYTSTKEACSGFASAPPCVVLMDMAPPTATGLGCLRTLRARLPDVPVVAYTAQDCAGMLLRTLSAGARGYLFKPLTPVELVPHLDKAAAGGLALCPRAERLLGEALHGLDRVPTPLGLSRREEQVLLCLCQNRNDPSNKTCANALGISEATVHAHLARIYRRLRVHSREAAIQVYTQHLHRGGG